jgi:UDP-N-acetylmuramoyl-tripeptide--D-alanyl-D-alanine ligase
MRWTGADVAAALGIGTATGDEAREYAGMVTDTRTLRPGSLFIALRGEHHDGHAFLAQAAQAGATGAIVDHVPAGAPDTLQYITVPDTLEALGALGRFHRRRLGVRVIAITGSNGKTTTKDLVRSVLSTRFRVHATPGNWNNLIGVPLTLLACPDDAQVVVAELGTNVPGEVAKLAGIAEPDAAVVTTVSAEHLEGLGDLEGVLREETSVLPWLPKGAAAVVSDEPAVLSGRARELTDEVHVAGFGERADADFRGFDLSLDEEGRVRFTWAERAVALRLRGKHNGWNAMLALALGRIFDVDDGAAIEALQSIEPAKMRGEFHRYGDLTVIADCYNSNPGSLAAAIALLQGMDRRGGRVAVLGTMRELGESSARLHEEAARDVIAAGIDLIVATGEFVDAFRSTGVKGDGLILEEDPVIAFDRFAPRLRGNEVVLLKGSRGVQLERLLPRFEERWKGGGVLHPHGETFGSRASESFTVDRADANTAEHPPTGDDHGRADGIRAEARVAMGG